MVLNLQKIWQPTNTRYHVTIRDNRENDQWYLAPHKNSMDLNRWLDTGSKLLELNVTNAFGRSATIILEDYDWWLWVSGNIEGGEQKIKVHGSVDFDVTFTDDGCISFYNNTTDWGNGAGKVVKYKILPFQY
ncbi:hypothetical protein FGLOB1_13703 [Fusarium globosum]|uniref:Uncharacterized protein n=1 Tax=Fusarium globosum TaxID=78864 RepID=A0A8H5XLW2_9HYPO|nr:hypothetical protein FGLOB1_13703 [Fusarium globosum]